ncbi:hypothetical protein [Amycolatopsis sp. NPDC098790]|uniref:hypothetical protein n=1 Tax=Amycolatopsis sp. NPDC098790 TaxID=3363939 RepID=UPI0037F87EDA
MNAIKGTPYEPYLVAPRAGGRESADAAVGTAAHRVLDAIFPEQKERLRVQCDEWLDGLPDGPAKRGGIRVVPGAVRRSGRGDVPHPGAAGGHEPHVRP